MTTTKKKFPPDAAYPWQRGTLKHWSHIHLVKVHTHMMIIHRWCLMIINANLRKLFKHLYMLFHIVNINDWAKDIKVVKCLYIALELAAKYQCFFHELWQILIHLLILCIQFPLIYFLWWVDFSNVMFYMDK